MYVCVTFTVCISLFFGILMVSCLLQTWQILCACYTAPTDVCVCTCVPVTFNVCMHPTPWCPTDVCVYVCVCVCACDIYCLYACYTTPTDVCVYVCVCLYVCVCVPVTFTV